MHPSGPKVMKLAPEAVANEVLRVGGFVVRSRLSIPPAVPLRNGFSMRNFASPLSCVPPAKRPRALSWNPGRSLMVGGPATLVPLALAIWAWFQTYKVPPGPNASVALRVEGRVPYTVVDGEPAGLWTRQIDALSEPPPEQAS